MANNQQLLMGEGAGSAPAVYIEDVFSTYLFTGTGGLLAITNNIDLSTKGGLVWLKNREVTSSHRLVDTDRGALSTLFSDATAAASTRTAPNTDVNSFTSTGFVAGNFCVANNYASWTFREQPKFFDVVAFTANSSGGGTFDHSLGSVPGCVITKSTSGTGDWLVYHRSTGTSKYLELNGALGEKTGTDWISVSSTSVTFGSGWLGANNSRIAYLFAHDAGGFGLSGTDNVISCGSFSSTALNNLGWEPQFVMMKRTDSTSGWFMFDNMRGLTAKTGFTNSSQYLYANTSDAETDITGAIGLDPLGFSSGQSGTYIYIAIRRGPMKVPTVGTSVYQGVVTGGSNFPYVITNTVVDFAIRRANKTTTQSYAASSRLTGDSYLLTTTTDAEAAGSGIFKFDSMSGWYNTSLSATPVVWNFQRAPGFFDVVCWTAVSPAGANVITHNLGVSPELVIAKTRSASARNWAVVCSYTGFGSSNGFRLNSASPQGNDGPSAVSATTVTMDMPSDITQAGETQVAYLFATCAGVSKVGSYTGNGSSQTIACGFAAGSRFVMIKRTDSTGDWYVWDSARGIIAGNDPHLSLNSTSAEVTSDDSVDTDNSGFIVNQVSATNVNVTSATYIFLAIA